MKYRAEIDGLRALAVVPVILFHAGFEAFSGGFIGVDIFFVISGYLITTILIEDLENNRFSIASFYERRARRILPALFLVVTVTTALAYFILLPFDFDEYAKSLLSVIVFASNIFFWKNSDYFATEGELTPLLHTWSLAIEEQYYVIFPIFLFLAWRFGKKRVFWMIVVFTAISLGLSEWGWRNKVSANFYLGPTRAWELFAGSITAFVVQKHGVQANNTLSLVGLAAILFAIFAYDETTPFPSIYTLVPVFGVVLLVLFADKKTFSAQLLSTKLFVGMGLISYSAYLWHQPLFALLRRLKGFDLSIELSLSLIAIVIVLSILSWRYIETPFRDKKIISPKMIFVNSMMAAIVIAGFSSFVIKTDGAAFRFPNFPSKPRPWTEVKCHGAKRLSSYSDPLRECLGREGNKKGGDFYLVGDSHAAQLTFALRELAKLRGADFFFINTESRDDYPYSFWSKDVRSDRLLEYILKNVDKDDIFITSFHKGYLNNSRDSHNKPSSDVKLNKKSLRFYQNLTDYMVKFNKHGIQVYLVKDGPLLSNTDTSLENCMYKHTNGEVEICSIEMEQEKHTRKRQSLIFEKLSARFDNVKTIDYLPILYRGNTKFSPISKEGEYLMLDRHHITEKVSLSLLPFFSDTIK